MVLDTSFLISLADPHRDNHQTARRYWKHFIEEDRNTLIRIVGDLNQSERLAVQTINLWESFDHCHFNPDGQTEFIDTLEATPDKNGDIVS